MFRLFSFVISLLAGAVIGAMFSIIENDLVQGSLVPEAFIIPVVSGTIISFLIYLSFVLVDQNRKVATNLELREVLLGSITRSAPLGIGIVRNRKFIHVNDYFCKMLGYESEELVGRNSRMIYPEEKEYNFVAEVKYGYIEDKDVGTVETRMLSKDGRIMHVLLSSTPLVRDDWSKGIAFTALDITVRKQMEDELRKSYEELEKRKDAYKEAHRLEQQAGIEKINFQNNMSHEIRTPLNGMQGMLQVLQSNLHTEENIEIVNYALDSCHRLSDLLNDIIELTRIEGGKEQLLNNPFDMQDVIKATAGLFGPAACQAGLEFVINQPERIPLLIGDDKKIKQILNNVVGNAIKFTSEGRVVLEISLLESESGRCRVFFAISDTGIGIPDEKVELIFNPYAQVDGSSTRHYEGAGLGLYIVKKLVDMMGGKIAVESESGSGTTVYLCFEFRAPSAGIDY